MNLRLLLTASLLLNLALAFFLLRPAGPGDTATPPGVASGTAPAHPAAIRPTGTPATNPATTVTNTLVRQLDWRTVESPDYREYIANLRGIGCPEQTIRDIIQADVNKLYDEKKKQVRGGPRKFEFWKAGNPLAGLLGNPETLQQMKALETEKLALLRALGIEPDAMSQMMASAGGNPMDAMFDFLPEGKRERLTKVMADFQGRLVDGAQDALTDPEAMMKAQREMQNTIKTILTPEEYLDYQLRFSNTATMLRMQSAGFDPTEKEFMDIFKLREAFDEEHSMFSEGNLTEAQQKERAAARTELDKSIKDLLGEPRYADYQRAQDGTYQQIHRIVSKANLPTTAANEVFDMKKLAEPHASEIRTRAGMNPDERSAALQAVRRETEQSIQQVLGPEAWDQFNRPNNTWWLRTIAPSP